MTDKERAVAASVKKDNKAVKGAKKDGKKDKKKAASKKGGAASAANKSTRGAEGKKKGGLNKAGKLSGTAGVNKADTSAPVVKRHGKPVEQTGGKAVHANKGLEVIFLGGEGEIGKNMTA